MAHWQELRRPCLVPKAIRHLRPGPWPWNPVSPSATLKAARIPRALDKRRSRGLGSLGGQRDLLDEVSWWQTDDLWPYALFAAVACIRAAASRAGVPVRQACQDLAQRAGCAAP